MSFREGPFHDRATTPVLYQLSTPVLLLDARGVPRFINPAAERLLGASAMPLPRPLEALAERARAEERSFSAHDLPIEGADRALHHVDAIVTPLDHTDGGAIVELFPQDRRREAGETLMAQHGAASMLVRSLGHELRNPLAGLRGAAQLLGQELDEPGQREYVAMIERECRRMELLLDRLGATSPRRGNDPVNIHEVAERVAALLGAEAGEDLKLERDYDPSLPPARASFDALVQVLLNLARNAWQAGARRIRFRTRLERDALVASSRHARALRLDVMDDGPGVPPALQPLVFFPMVTGRKDGTGLGLALAQAIAIRHDGLITFESDPGNTVFTLLLPLPDDSHE